MAGLYHQLENTLLNEKFVDLWNTFQSAILFVPQQTLYPCPVTQELVTAETGCQATTTKKTTFVATFLRQACWNGISKATQRCTVYTCSRLNRGEKGIASTWSVCKTSPVLFYPLYNLNKSRWIDYINMLNTPGFFLCVPSKPQLAVQICLLTS